MNLLLKKIACFALTVCMEIAAACSAELEMISKGESTRGFVATETTEKNEYIVRGYGKKIEQKKVKENKIKVNTGNQKSKSWN